MSTGISILRNVAMYSEEQRKQHPLQISTIQIGATLRKENHLKMLLYSD